MTVLSDLSRDLAALVSRAAPAVVGVRHRSGQGSGVVLSADGYVLTNSHVARSEGPLALALPGGGQAAGVLVGADDRTDLAVVRAAATGLASVELADARRLQVGELVVAIGNPLGFERSVSLGLVSALHRDLPTRGGLLEGLIQTDAAVNPGNSGGPLLDAQGAVVGITTAMVPWARGIGFAVPARAAAWVAAVLIQRGEVRRPKLGVVVRAQEEPAAGPGERAIRVLRVEGGTPAAAAGLQPDDLVLVAGGTRVGGLDDLQRALVLAETPDVALQVLRSGTLRDLVVRLPAA